MRKVFDFHGGVHPPENKHQSVRTPIADAGIPPELVIPLSQHIGAPSSPVVGVGDHVLKGQVIAEVGSTGKSTGPHLHFEVRRKGKAMDPLYLISKN